MDCLDEQQFRIRASGTGNGFTLIELLTTIRIISVLASLIMPAVFRAMGQTRQTACLNHLRQLALGFTMHHGDYSETFPGCASERTYGPQPEDWTWWQRDRDFSQSAIARYVSEFNPTLFRCPTDKDALALLQSTNPNPYAYSFSLTSYDLEQENQDDPAKNLNLGLASVLTKDTPRNGICEPLSTPPRFFSVRCYGAELLLIYPRQKE